jgi:hypothetical protein
MKMNRYVWGALSVLICSLGMHLLLDSIRHAGPYCRRICFARGNLYGSWVGGAGDPIWEVLANATGGAAHAARITLLKHLERRRQFLGGF